MCSLKAYIILKRKSAKRKKILDGYRAWVNFNYWVVSIMKSLLNIE